MENCCEENRAMVEEPLLKENNSKKGGFRTLPFIIGNDALEKMATYGLMANMTLYLMKEYHMEITTASNVLYIWSASTSFMPLIGAMVADSFLGRFYIIGAGSVISLMGMILLWLTTIIPQARPPPCGESTPICIPPTDFQFAFLCTSFAIISIGAGGIRSSSLAFGADQLEKGGNFQGISGVKESYFSWYYASYTISILIAITCVVYIQDNMGWGVGFLVPALLMFAGVGSFFLASPFYVRLNSKSSLVTGFIQVAVASLRNRHLKLSDNTMNYVCHCKNGSNLVFPSRNLRFLNKACIIIDPRKDLTPDGAASNPWSLCTVDQVEELKALIRIIPIWSSGAIMYINISQNSFPLLQAASMDRRITSTFTIPAASFGTFTIITVILWIAFYDRLFIPTASRIKGRQVRISTKSRMGLGIFFSFMAMIATSAVEGIRRSLAIGDESSTVQLSAMWLVPQYCLNGFAEASNAIAQNEFYFSELPRSMSSVASTLFGIGACVASLLASFLLNSVDKVTKAGGNEGWITSDINEGRYDYYYLVLAALSMANMMYFLVCCKVYGPLKEERKVVEEGDGI